MAGLYLTLLGGGVVSDVMTIVLSVLARSFVVRGAPMEYRWSSNDPAGGKGKGGGEAGDSGDSGFSETGAEGARTAAYHTFCGFSRRTLVTQHAVENCTCQQCTVQWIKGLYE